MTPTTYQTPEIRDSNDNIIKQGSFGKNTALANSTNDGWIDYVANDLEFLYGLAKDEVVPVSELPSTGDTNKTYLLTTTGVCYRWDGTEWVEISSSEAVSRADSAAYLAEQWATKTSGTVDGTEYSAKYYAEQAQDAADDLSESLEQIATNTANIEENAENIATNTANITQNATDIDIAEKKISNIEKLLQGNLYDYQTDTDSAYTKTVPQGAMPYASLDSVGGKTLVFNQLYNVNYTATSRGITVTVVDGAVSMSGSSDSAGNGVVFCWSAFAIPIGHKFLWQKDFALKGTDYLFDQYNSKSSDDATNTIITARRDYSIIQLKNVEVGNDYTNVSGHLMFYDLTLMYGAGNEPTTVAEFQQQFPAQYYSYNAGTLLSAGVTEVVSKDSNNTTLQTITIPAEIQALEGYGWSAGSVFNYVDFEAKKFVQEVGSRAYASGDESDATVITDGTTTYYPLNPAVETDISQYLTDDNLIEVESGGSLTFPNSNGTDYQIPVPSAETYMVDLQASL